jgi:hypothetical protein
MNYFDSDDLYKLNALKEIMSKFDNSIDAVVSNIRAGYI